MKLAKIREKGYRCENCRFFDRGVCKKDYLPKSFMNSACEHYKKKFSS